jgi:Tol biopolymer transport system component
VDKVGGRVAWSRKNDLIAFSKFGQDASNRQDVYGGSEVYVMQADGSNQVCLTCGRAPLAPARSDQPDWHPSGNYLVFQSLDPNLSMPPGIPAVLASYFTQGGAGIHNNLWVMARDGSSLSQLTHVQQGEASLHPHFSHDGSKLLWTTRARNGRGGEWALALADVVIDGQGARIVNERRFRPQGAPDTFYESHGFSPDDKSILFTANIGRRQTFDLDIWTMDLASQTATQLTDSAGVWDEHAQYSPSGRRIVWVSSQGYSYSADASWAATLRTDYWTMDADGSNKTRLTYFNTPGAAEYTGERVIVADVDWNRDGTSLVATVSSQPERRGRLLGRGADAGRATRIELIELASPQ